MFGTIFEITTNVVDKATPKTVKKAISGEEITEDDVIEDGLALAVGAALSTVNPLDFLDN